MLHKAGSILGSRADFTLHFTYLVLELGWGDPGSVWHWWLHYNLEKQREVHLAHYANKFMKISQSTFDE